MLLFFKREARLLLLLIQWVLVWTFQWDVFCRDIVCLDTTHVYISITQLAAQKPDVPVCHLVALAFRWKRLLRNLKLCFRCVFGFGHLSSLPHRHNHVVPADTGQRVSFFAGLLGSLEMWLNSLCKRLLSSEEFVPFPKFQIHSPFSLAARTTRGKDI